MVPPELGLSLVFGPITSFLPFFIGQEFDDDSIPFEFVVVHSELGSRSLIFTCFGLIETLPVPERGFSPAIVPERENGPFS